MGAFRVAIELDLKRRENDKKINLLFTEMRDMMTALVEYAVPFAFYMNFIDNPVSDWGM